MKKGMQTFVGCKVGERRSGILRNAEGYLKPFLARVQEGYLNAEDDGKRIWFSLTDKGASYVESFKR
jgi:hypothetical protein